jgi:hypothetical protein
MKKLFIALTLLTLLSFKTNEEKKLKVELTLSEWNAVLQVIDQSNAPHVNVEAVKKVLIDQLREQVDTTKRK